MPQKLPRNFSNLNFEHFVKSLIADTFEILDLQTFLVMAILLNILMLICIWECKSNLYNCILYRQEICNFNELYGWCFRKTTDTSCLFFAQNFLGISLKLLSFFRVSPLWVLGFFDCKYSSISTVSIFMIFYLTRFIILFYFHPFKYYYTHAIVSFPCSFLAVNHHNKNWVPFILTHNL